MGKKKRECGINDFLFVGTACPLALLILGGVLFALGYTINEDSKLLDPRKLFVELEKGCNITKVEYEFTNKNKKEEDNGRRLRRRMPRCADTYTYSFSTLTNPPRHLQDKHIMKKFCEDDLKKESTLHMGNITKCWRFDSSNPLTKLDDRTKAIEHYDCYNEDCAKVVDPYSLYIKSSGTLLIVGIAMMSGGLLLALITVAIYCKLKQNKSNHKGQSRSNPMAAVAHTTERNEKSKPKKDTKALVKKMQLTLVKK